MNSRKARLLFGWLAVLALVLASCAPAATPAKPASTPGEPAKAAVTPTSVGAKSGTPAPTPKPAADAPRYSGVFTSSITGNPPSLDAHQESTTNLSVPLAAFYTNLVQADPLTGDKWVPGLAEKWSTSADGLTWIFDIRQGVKFHDGTPFSADDAVFNLKRLTDPPKGILSNMSFVLKPAVKSIEKQGNQVRVSFNHPFAIMLDILGNNYCPMYSEKYLEKNNDMKTSVMGTGPFKFKNYTPGVGLEGVKNPDFWVKGRPYLDGFRFLILRDGSTRLSAFRTGKLSITGRTFAALVPNEMETVKKENAQIQFHRSPTIIGSWFFMNIRKPPFKDLRVRQAINLALDRQAAIKVLAQGYGVISKPFPVKPWGLTVEELTKKPGYGQAKDQEVAQAKKMMQEAGYPDGFELTILARQMWQSKDVAVFMTDQLAKIGIKAKVQTLEDAIFWDTGRKAGHEAMVYTPFWSFTDPQWMGRYWAPASALNFSGNDDDKELANMWSEQIKIVDVEKRRALIRRVEERLLDTLPGISVVWYDAFIGVRPEVKNFAPGMQDSVGNTLEEIWLAK
ncbi:MAG: ABC transporter substrate-binding protein [Chloroflexi bacterium]|nr:ABC transporter substrate-binding protein [Chloroflexota bacterium]